MSVLDNLVRALNYVADMTFCGADAEWHFKPGYDPQIVLDAIKESDEYDEYDPIADAPLEI